MTQPIPHGFKKIAVIHDWMQTVGGAEKVLAQVLQVVPDADVYTLFDFMSDAQRQHIVGNSKVTTSYLNRLPKVVKYYRKLLPLFPAAIESFDLSAYDLVISCSYSVAKGVITGPDQLHISYVHSPARYAWDLTHQYLKQSKLDKGLLGFITRNSLSKFRIWDCRTANSVDRYLCNSDFVRRRIQKFYRRDSDIVYPPVNINKFSLHLEKDDFYLTASRMVPYKRIDAIVAAFALMPEKRLIVIGDGPEMQKIKDIAGKSSNITLLGYQEDSVLQDHMRRAKAFVFAAEEDFGIVPVEAQACGTPVIAYGVGGALENVVASGDKPTGVFFAEQTPTAIAEAVRAFESRTTPIDPAHCRQNAEYFSEEAFRNRLTAILVEESSHRHKSPSPRTQSAA